MAKRGAEYQMAAEGRFEGDGFGAVQTEAPKQATAAQMAARKIKSLKGRKPGTPGRAGSPGAAAVQNPFGGFSNGPTAPTSQSFPPASNQPQQNGGFGSNTSFGGFTSNFDFAFNAPGSSTTGFNFGGNNTNANSQPSAPAPGGMFNFGGGTAETAAPQSKPFNFGGNTPSQATNMFGAPVTTQTPNTFSATSTAPSFSGFGASTSTAPAFNFGASTSDSTPSNLFGQAASSAKPTDAPTASTTNLFGASTPNVPSNPFGQSSQTANAGPSNIFGAASDSTPSTGLFGASTNPPSSTSAPSNPFAALKASQPEPASTPAKPLFGATADPQTPANATSSTTFGSFTAPQATVSGNNLFGTPAAPSAQTPAPSKPAFSFTSGLSQAPSPAAGSPNMFGQSLPSKESQSTTTATNGGFTNGEATKSGAFSFLNPSAQQSAAEKPAASAASSPFSKLPRSPEKQKPVELPKQTNTSSTGFGNIFASAKPAASADQLKLSQPVNGAPVVFGSLSNPPAMTTLIGDAASTTPAHSNTGNTLNASPVKATTNIPATNGSAKSSKENPFSSLGTPSKPVDPISKQSPVKQLSTAAYPSTPFSGTSPVKSNEQQSHAHSSLQKMQELNSGLLSYLKQQDQTADFTPIFELYKYKALEIRTKRVPAPSTAQTGSIPSSKPVFTAPSTQTAGPTVNGTPTQSAKRKAEDEATPSPKKSKNEPVASSAKGSKTAGVMERLFNDFDASKNAPSPPAKQADKPAASSGPPKFNLGKTNFMAQFTKQAATDDSDDSDDDSSKSSGPPPPLAGIPKFNIQPSSFMSSFAKAAKANQDDDAESDSDDETAAPVMKKNTSSAGTPKTAGKDEASDAPATSRQASLGPASSLFINSRNASPTPSTNGGAADFDSPNASGAYNNPFAKYSPAPSGDGEQEHDSDDDDHESNKPSENAGKSLFDRVTRDNSVAGSAESTPLKPSPAGDRTWNPNTPIKFANAASTSATPSLFGFSNSGASSPGKSVFGGNSLPTFNFGQASPTPADSENKENANSETPKPLFPSTSTSSNLFGSAAKPAPAANFGSLLGPNGPSVFSSANTSRASTPGATTDGGDSGAEDSSVAPEHAHDEADGAHETVLTALSEQELADNDILFEISKAKAQKVVGGKYEDIGTGPLRLLKSKKDERARVLMRKLNGRVAINSHLLASGRYALEARKPNTLWASFYDEGKPATFYITFAKANVAEANKLVELLEENKAL